MSIGEILTEQARTRPDAPALIDTRDGRVRQLTFADLEREVIAAADWLQGLGITKGKAALVFVPMSADLYVALLALFRLGAVALFLDPSAGREHIEQCCARCPPDAFIGIPKAHWLRMMSSAVRQIPRKIVVGGWAPFARRWMAGTIAGARSCPPASPAEHDPALVTFTSGSTGVPKAAVRTHGFLVAQHAALARSIELVAGEIDLATLPIFTLANLASGLTTVIPDVDLRRPGAVDGARISAQIDRWRVNRLTASPAFFERLIGHARAAGKSFPALGKLHTGGAPVFPRLLSALQEVAPNAHVVAVYGSTEAEPIAHVGADEIDADDDRAMRFGRGLLAGPPVVEVRMRVVRDRWGTPRGKLTADEFLREILPAGEAGEIVVAGEHVLKGYLGGVGDEETKFSVEGETWHRTGDAGMIDDRGRLWLLGRCAAKIRDERGELFPFTVECVAMTFPEVARAAVLAHATKRLLIVESMAAADAFIPRLREATAWAGIDDIRVVPRLPVDKRHNAKIDYPALRRMLGS